MLSFTLKMKVKLMEEKNETCAIRIELLDSI